MTEEKQLVVQHLRQWGREMSALGIANDTHLSPEVVSETLTDLISAGIIEIGNPIYGMVTYQLVGHAKQAELGKRKGKP